MTIAFIGLGNMGMLMAKNLLAGGFRVHAYNRSVEKRNVIAASGAVVFDAPEKAVADAEIVITMLSDDAAVSEVSDKTISHMKIGTIHLSMSTIAPSTSLKLSQIHQQHQLIYLASPVMGRPPAAEAKQLFILLSGESPAKQKVKPVLDAMSQRTFDYGNDPSTAHTVKIMMNYMIFVITGMLSEVMLLAEKTGVDKQSLLDTMTSTVFGAPVFKIYGSLIAQEKDIANGFAAKLASKDLRLMQETAAAHQLKLPLGNIVQEHLVEMINNGEGQKDVSLIVSHLRKRLKSRP